MCNSQFTKRYNRKHSNGVESARRQAAFHSNVAYSASENAKGTNTCEITPYKLGSHAPRF